MSLEGSLEDVSVADVLQFVHLGGRSGTLTLISGEARGEIGFHRGRIISARGPSSTRLGDLLVRTGAVSQRDLEGALRIQKRSACPPALGHVLIQMGVLTSDRLKESVEEHIEQTVYQLVAWTRGTFTFAVDDIKPIDDLSMSPGDILPDIHVNTQMVLLEAARIIDERNRREPAETATPTAAGGGSASTVEPVGAAPAAPLRASRSPRPPSEPQSPPRVQLVTDDDTLGDAVLEALAPAGALAIRVPARDAGTSLPGENAPIVLVDLRDDRAGTEALETIRRMRPRAPLIALADHDTTRAIQAYQAGALAVVRRDPRAIVACVGNAIRFRDETASEHDLRRELKAGVAKIRRVFGEIRSGLVTATISLNLMNLVSESVDRAILFVAARSDLLVLGAFGHTMSGQPIAPQIRGTRIKFEEAGALADSVKNGRSHTLPFDEVGLPEHLKALLGRPACPQSAIYPLLGSRKAVATMYADNGRREQFIHDHDFIDMATSQVGMYYENELLRRKLKAAKPPTSRLHPRTGGRQQQTEEP